MAGKPVIVSTHPAMSFVIEGKFGFTVDYGDISHLAEAMQNLLDDPDLCQALGRNGREYVLNNLGWDTVSRKIEDVYSQVMYSNKHTNT
jgi:glycosyltransferase involved in cell wall biosynthesis